MERADDCRDITDLVEKLIRLSRGVVILRESPTWTGGSEIFHGSTPGLYRVQEFPHVLPVWVWCTAGAGLENVREAGEYSKGAACCPGCVLCPVPCWSANLCTKDAASATGKSQLRRFSCFLQPPQHKTSSEQAQLVGTK